MVRSVKEVQRERTVASKIKTEWSIPRDYRYHRRARDAGKLYEHLLTTTILGYYRYFFDRIAADVWQSADGKRREEAYRDGKGGEKQAKGRRRRDALGMLACRYDLIVYLSFVAFTFV